MYTSLLFKFGRPLVPYILEFHRTLLCALWQPLRDKSLQVHKALLQPLNSHQPRKRLTNQSALSGHGNTQSSQSLAGTSGHIIYLPASRSLLPWTKYFQVWHLDVQYPGGNEGGRSDSDKRSEQGRSNRSNTGQQTVYLSIIFTIFVSAIGTNWSGSEQDCNPTDVARAPWASLQICAVRTNECK